MTVGSVSHIIKYLSVNMFLVSTKLILNCNMNNIFVFFKAKYFASITLYIL